MFELSEWLLNPCATSPTTAVIPGLAPGIVAILPHLIFFLLVSLTLVASPRTWWKVGVVCARHPGRSLATLSLITLAIFGLRATASLMPLSEPGAAIANRVNGFSLGDILASGVAPRGSGPLTLPSSSELQFSLATPGLAMRPVFSGEGKTCFRFGNHRITAIDLETGSEASSIDLPGLIAAKPLSYSREIDRVPRTGLVIPVAVDGRGAILLLEEGITRRLDLDSAPEAICLVDDRLVIALKTTLHAVSIAEPGTLRELWRIERSPLHGSDLHGSSTRAVALAGDENGFLYLLDTRGLWLIHPDGVSLELLVRAENSPRGLAVREGLAYVLEQDIPARETPAQKIPAREVPKQEPPARKNARARLRCIDPAADDPELWSAWIHEIATHRPIAAEFGIILTTRTGFEIRDPLRGNITDRVDLEATPACAVVATNVSCFALLANGTLLRYSPGLRRVAWSTSIQPGDEFSTISHWLILAGRSLVAHHRGRSYFLTEAMGSARLIWSHSRGGTDRTGTASGVEVPLLADVLWKTELPGMAAGSPLPVGDEGKLWLVPRNETESCHLLLTAEDGEIKSDLKFAGSFRGLIRHGDRAIVALGENGRGRIVTIDTDSQDLMKLWDVPLPQLGSREILAASENSIVVALEQSILALSVHDGGKRWEFPLRNAGVPLTTGNLVVALGSDAAGAAVIAIEDGELLWRHELSELANIKGSASLREDLLCAAVSSSNERGHVLSLDIADGKERWKFPLDGVIHGPVSISEDTVIFRGDEKIYLLGLDGKLTGSMRSSSSRDADALFALAPGIVVNADGRRVQCVDTATFDMIWEVELDANVDTLLIDGDRVIVTAGSLLIALGVEE